jgi:hypothetical protein
MGLRWLELGIWAGAAVSLWKPDHRTVTIYIVSFRFLAQDDGIFLGNVIRAGGKRWVSGVALADREAVRPENR